MRKIRFAPIAATLILAACGGGGDDAELSFEEELARKLAAQQEAPPPVEQPTPAPVAPNLPESSLLAQLNELPTVERVEERAAVEVSGSDPGLKDLFVEREESEQFATVGSVADIALDSADLRRIVAGQSEVLAAVRDELDRTRRELVSLKEDLSEGGGFAAGTVAPHELLPPDLSALYLGGETQWRSEMTRDIESISSLVATAAEWDVALKQAQGSISEIRTLASSFPELSDEAQRAEARLNTVAEAAIEQSAGPRDKVSPLTLRYRDSRVLIVEVESVRLTLRAGESRATPSGEVVRLISLDSNEAVVRYRDETYKL